ncbi:hypothetical protein D0U04_15780 [Bacillus clarus]|uniref:Uncharacterized protein n=1 Tax=Bacillus clarus TaxID=2338372 RepID=A0A090Z619_9BACI|nr:hypothetical protein DJ93_3734 [Bacillus clarus]RFT66014.1 hypothetical protein D0U04_15780 [Bacillus clarus]
MCECNQRIYIPWIILLYFESRFEGIFKVDYATAHAKTVEEGYILLDDMPKEHFPLFYKCVFKIHNQAEECGGMENFKNIDLPDQISFINYILAPLSYIVRTFSLENPQRN